MTFDEWWKGAAPNNSMPGIMNAAFRELSLNAWNAAAMAEREACVQVCADIVEDYWNQASHGDTSGASDHRQAGAEECVRAIRSRCHS